MAEFELSHTGPVIDGAITEIVTKTEAVSNLASASINVADGNIKILTMTGDLVLVDQLAVGQSFSLFVKGADTYTLSLPASTDLGDAVWPPLGSECLLGFTKLEAGKLLTFLSWNKV